MNRDKASEIIKVMARIEKTEPEIEYSQSIGGNYEGTEFKVTIRRDEKKR